MQGEEKVPSRTSSRHLRKGHVTLLKEDLDSIDYEIYGDSDDEMLIANMRQSRENSLYLSQIVSVLLLA